MLLITLSTITINLENGLLKAEDPPVIPEIDYEYIETITQYLSDIINTTYDEERGVSER